MNYPLYIKHAFCYDELGYEAYYAFFNKGRFTKLSIDRKSDDAIAVQIITFAQQNEGYYITGLLENKNTIEITKEAFFAKYDEVLAMINSKNKN